MCRVSCRFTLAIMLAALLCSPQSRAAEPAAPFQPPMKIDLRIPARHPYLALMPADIARAKSRAAQFPWAKASLARCLSKGDDAIAKPWGKLPSVGDWPHHMRHAAQMHQAALAYAFSGKGDYAAWVRNGLLAYADLYPRLPLEPSSCRLTVGSGLFEAMWLVEVTRAYDLVAESGALSSVERQRIETDLLRTAAECFYVRDYRSDPRGASMNFRCYNHHAWHMSALGLVGLAIRDAKLVDYAVNSSYGFCHLVAHDIRDDGLFWERTPGYHYFTLQALVPWTEAMFHCGVDIYSLQVPTDRSRDEDVHYVTDAGDGPKSLKLMFDAPPYLAFPDLTFPAIGDNNRCAYTGEWLCLPNVDRYSAQGWLLPENLPLPKDMGPWQEGLQEAYVALPDQVFPAMGDNKRGPLRGDWLRLVAFHRYRDVASGWLVSRSEPLLVDKPPPWQWLIYDLPKAETEGVWPPNNATFANTGKHAHGCSLFPSSGIAMLREVDGNFPARPESTAVSLSYGPYGGGHAHRDKLNLVLYAQGHQWLPAFGSMLYGSSWKGGWTAHTVSHNTLVVDEVSQEPYGAFDLEWPVDSAARRVCGRLDAFDPANKMVRASCENAYQGFRLSRHTRLAGHVVVDDFDVRPIPVVSSVSQESPGGSGNPVSQPAAAAPSGAGHPVSGKQSAAPRQFDYVLHVDGRYAESSLAIAARSGPLGKRCGYQHVVQQGAGRLSEVQSVTFAAGAHRLRIWIVPLDDTPTELVLAKGPTNRPDEEQAMLILRRRAGQTRFVTVLEPIRSEEPLLAVRAAPAKAGAAAALVLQTPSGTREITLP